MVERAITGAVNNPGRHVTETTIPAPNFASAEQTVTIDTILDVAHGLGAIPTLVMLILRCTTANLGYSQNDEIIIYTTGGEVPDKNIVVFSDATNVTIVQSSAFQLLDFSTLNNATPTTTSWRWVVRAWT